MAKRTIMLLALLPFGPLAGCSGETAAANEGVESQIKGSLVDGPSGGKNGDAGVRKADAAPK